MSKYKVVVITGASSGIGEATTRLLSEKGFRVYAGVRNIKRAQPMLNVQFGPLDVTDDASVSTFVEWVLSEAGRIDVVINNAGISLVGPVEKTSVALFDTNVFGPLRMIRAVLPSMRKARHGLIVNISSVLGYLPAPFMGLYASSKHALEGMSESLDHETRDYNVRVVLVQPSFTNTKLDNNAKQVSEPLGAYAPRAETVKHSSLVMLSGTVQREGNTTHLIVRSVADWSAELSKIAERDTLTLPYQPGDEYRRGGPGMDSRLRSAGKVDELAVRSRDFR